MTELHSGPVTELLDQHRRMALIRVFEETTATLYAAGEIPGFVHLSVGQVAVPVGVCSALRDSDVITSTGLLEPRRPGPTGVRTPDPGAVQPDPRTGVGTDRPAGAHRDRRAHAGPLTPPPSPPLELPWTPNPAPSTL
jgi:hypothetical protein